MILHLVRILFLLMVIATSATFAFQDAITSTGQWSVALYIGIPSLLAVIAVFVDMFWRHKHLQVLSGLFIGIIGGVVLAFILSQLLVLLLGLFPIPEEASRPAELEKGFNVQITTTERIEHSRQVEAYSAYMTYERTIQLLKLLLGSVCVFACTSIVLQTRDDFRFILPDVEFSKETKGARPLLLDTSAIIDGRIGDFFETGILEAEVVVPRFILKELQSIADSSDKLKRNRGRRGLDVLDKLQKSETVDIRIVQTNIRDENPDTDVDNMLVLLAEQRNGRIVTNDFNLNKVAQLRGIDVININDLANALKSIMLPGESVTLRIVKPGEEPGQGIGYLEDGTMVVVEQGRDHMGREIVISVTSALQTSAGRMVFGKVDADATFSQVRKTRASTNSGTSQENGNQG